MYKVFFADDEAAMRAGIRNNIDWDNSRFTLAGEAPDGELALSLIQEIRPDILITDVKMPFMDGIELSRRAKKSMPWIKVIILSGHDEFEYAKQAIIIGVEEYLIKPVTSDSLMETLNRVADGIDAEKEELKNIKQLIDDKKQIQTGRLLSGLMYGNADISVAECRAVELDLSIEADYYLILLIDLHIAVTESYSSLEKAGVRVTGMLSGWENAIFFNQGADRIICVLKGAEEAAVEEDAYTCAQAVKYEAEREANCQASVAIGSIVSEIGSWPKSLADADMARRYLNLTNRKQIISIQDIRSGGLMPFKEIEKLPTIDKLRYALKEDVPQFLEDYFSNFNSLSVASFMFINYVFMDILMASSKMVAELGGDPSAIFSEYTNINGILETNSDLDTVKKILSEVLERAIDFRVSHTGSKYSEIITRAQEYIKQNYDQQGISLHTVAKEVNMSPNHFSTIFSQETGETFISYITKIRLEQAKILLKTTQMRTSDIGYSVGYNDTHYFSYVFKKNTGMTPKEFRK